MPAPLPPPPERLAYEDFAKLDLRIAEIVEAAEHPDAQRLLVLKLDAGGGESRQVVAGIKAVYAPADLLGRSVVFLANLSPASIRGVESQGMILAAADPDGQAVLLAPDRGVPAGSKVR